MHFSNNLNFHNYLRCALGLALTGAVSLPCQGAGPVNVTKTAKPAVSLTKNTLSIESAWALYTQRQYGASADAFEALIRAAAVPNARLFYYAALANRESGRTARSTQIFQYIVDNFPDSAEAGCCKTALEHAKSQEKLSGKPATAKSANAQGGVTSDSALATPSEIPVKVGKKLDFVFTPEEIAKEGAHGIDQVNNENCWFEAAMSALAMLPRGQRLLASMVRYGDKGAYLVRFPGDGKEYVITKANLKEEGIENKALWASLIECAENRKYPNNVGVGHDKHWLEIGLALITGNKCELVYPNDCSIAELSSFIGGAVRSQSPVVCATGNKTTGPELVFDNHAYTIIGFDPSRNMVTLRNPHGQGARRFHHPTDPQHLQFETLDDGVFKMSLPLFKTSFDSLARSFI